jgi:streptogramin lyase
VCGSVASASLAVASPPPSYTTYTTPTATSNPDQIVSGPDGNLWFTEPTADKIGRITPAGVITEFAVPTVAAEPNGIALGPDGNLWFTERDGDKVGKITTAGVITEYPLTAGAGPQGIVAGADGNLWIAEFGLGDIGVVSTAGAVLNEYGIGLIHAKPINVVLGADDRVWFGINNTDDIGAIDTTGTISEYVTTDPVFYLASGADGNVWFSGATSNHTGGNVTPAGVVTELGNVGPLFSMTAGPDGDIWGDETVNNEITEIDPAGSIAASYSYLGTVPDGSISDVTDGADGNIWFTFGSDGIGVLNFHPVAPKPPVLATTGVGPDSWMAGGFGLGAVALGVLIVATAAWRRPKPLN